MMHLLSRPLRFAFALLGCLSLALSACGGPVDRYSGEAVLQGYGEASVQLVEAAMAGHRPQAVMELLATAEPEALARELATDAHRLAFWLNVYNAYIILLLREQPELYEDRGAFFGEDRFTIAGERLSFDEVEHGILRRSKNKYSMGFLGKLRVREYEKRFRVEAVDARIHFALNCGANSCPPVAVYHADGVGEELDASARAYLQSVTQVQGKEVTTTVLFSWFRKDFSDRGGITAYLHRYGAIPATLDNPDLTFAEYDWTMNISNFRE